MPLTTYSYRNQRLLDSFAPIPNFTANSFTFYNQKTGKVIVDAIRTDKDGNVIFKDEKTEVYLKDLIGKANSIDETLNADGSFNLYFSDKFNERISLGEVYKNLFLKQPKNMNFWFGGRASRKLSDAMDLTIIDAYLTTADDVELQDPSVDTVNIEYAETWKNKWIDIPCLEVVTPEYIDGKFASISATIVFKIKTDKPIITGFRIYDATAGLELTRVIHTAERSSSKFTSYTVPLHYQGPLPDTGFSSSTNFTGLTYQDLQNIQIENGVETGKDVSKNPDQYESNPETKHVIKLQWITCDLATELDNLGRPIGTFGRYFNETGDTSLDVTVFSATLKEDQIIQLNGSIDTLKLSPGEKQYKHVFENIPLGLKDGYAISFSTNKNINITLIQKNANGFYIEWQKEIKGLTIDWSISYKITEKDVNDLERINDPQRSINHYLFTDKKIATDFCNEITDIAGIEYSLYRPPVYFVDYEPDCVCCDCCEDTEYEVKFRLLTGQEEPPTCDNDLFWLDPRYFNQQLNEGGFDPPSGTSSSSEETLPPSIIVPPLFEESTSSFSYDIITGEAEGLDIPLLVVGNSQFFTFEELEELAGLKDVSSFIEAMSGAIPPPVTSVGLLSSQEPFWGETEDFPNFTPGYPPNSPAPSLNYVKYFRDGNNDIIYYTTTDSYGTTRYAPDCYYFRFMAEIFEKNRENDDIDEENCQLGFYIPSGQITPQDIENALEEGVGGGTGEFLETIYGPEEFKIRYDSFIGFDSNLQSIATNTVIYSSIIETSGVGASGPFYMKDKQYFITFRIRKGIFTPEVYLFEHDDEENIGTLDVIGLPGKVHFFKFFSRQEDPDSADTMEYVVYYFLPTKTLHYADLHIDELFVHDPIDLIAISDKNPLLPQAFKVTNALVSRDLINKRDEFIEQFPIWEEWILKYNILSGEEDLTTSLPLSGAVESECSGLGLNELECTLLVIIEGILDDNDHFTKLKTIYGYEVMNIHLQGRVIPDLPEEEINSDGLVKTTGGFILVKKRVVGTKETLTVVRQPLKECESTVLDISAANLIQDVDFTFGHKSWFVMPSYDILPEEVAEVEEAVTKTFVKKKTLSLNQIYDSDYTFEGKSFKSSSEFVDHINAIDRAYQIGIENLKYDRKQQPHDVAAQLVSSNLIKLDIPHDSSYDAIFEDGTSYLKVNDPTKLKTVPVTTSGFLGVKAFKHNLVVFDPRPNVIRKPNQRPLFPGYDPIYQKRTLDEILQHIYTTVYPSDEIPAFPNFRIGDIAINGEIYNPLYDYRNYRLIGYYETSSKANEETFISLPMSSINKNYNQGAMFNINGRTYRLITDVYTSGAVITSIFGNTIQKVRPSKLRFQRIDQTLYDLNLGNQFTV